jgi:hypothetical protein
MYSRINTRPYVRLCLEISNHHNPAIIPCNARSPCNMSIHIPKVFVRKLQICGGQHDRLPLIGAHRRLPQPVGQGVAPPVQPAEGDGEDVDRGHGDEQGDLGGQVARGVVRPVGLRADDVADAEGHGDQGAGGDLGMLVGK